MSRKNKNLKIKTIKNKPKFKSINLTEKKASILLKPSEMSSKTLKISNKNIQFDQRIIKKLNPDYFINISKIFKIS